MMRIRSHSSTIVRRVQVPGLLCLPTAAELYLHSSDGRKVGGIERTKHVVNVREVLSDSKGSRHLRPSLATDAIKRLSGRIMNVPRHRIKRQVLIEKGIEKLGLEKKIELDDKYGEEDKRIE